jgi:hypothetical protein
MFWFALFHCCTNGGNSTQTKIVQEFRRSDLVRFLRFAVSFGNGRQVLA